MITNPIISASITIFILILYNKSKKYYLQKQKTIQPLLKLFGPYKEIFISIFQNIFLFSENEYFDYLAVIVTLARAYDPYSLLFPQKETLKITGKCKKRINSFVYKKSLTLKHLGLCYVTKQKESGNYKVYGNRVLVPFVEKYKIDMMYISYFPKEIVRDCSFKCIFYLEVDYNILNNADFLNDFTALMCDIEDCSDKKFEENKLKYEKNLGLEEMKINIKNREKEKIEHRQASGLEVTKKRKEKNKMSFIRSRK
ncbi:hypothetical protein COBT_003403 [Conglomerata obtusa]